MTTAWQIVTASEDQQWPCTIIDGEGRSLLATHNGTPIIRDRALAERVVAALNGREPEMPTTLKLPRKHAEDAQKAQVEYVVGFAFDWYGRVALIRKNRPEWQVGRLNGIGGHVEPGESADAAMEREFWEETATRLTAWDLFAVMDFPGARIHFYRLLDLDPRVLDGLITNTDEQVCLVWPTDGNWHRMVPNLSWLLPLAAYTADTYEPIRVHAQMAEAVTPSTQTPSDADA